MHNNFLENQKKESSIISSFTSKPTKIGLPEWTNGQSIDLVVRRDRSSICIDPPQPVYVSRGILNPLLEGNYSLNYYIVTFEDQFPPNLADYDKYFVETIGFEVLGAPPTIDATSNFNLVLLILILFLSGFYGLRFIKDQ